MKTRPAKAGRTFLTKAMLLPLPESRALALSLENHLALATLRAGRGDFYQMSCLLRAIYLSYFIDSELKDVTRELFTCAEQALGKIVDRQEGGEGWSIADDEWRMITPILGMLNHQLSYVSRHIFERAWARLLNFVSSDQESPIRDERPQ